MVMKANENEGVCCSALQCFTHCVAVCCSIDSGDQDPPYRMPCNVLQCVAVILYFSVTVRFFGGLKMWLVQYVLQVAI